MSAHPPPDGPQGIPPRQAHDRSLATRLLRVVFGCYFAVALVVTAGQMVTEYLSAHRRLETEIQGMERTFGQGLADAMWSFNAGVRNGILSGMMQMPVVTGVEVSDEHGRVVERIDDPRTAGHRLSAFDKPFARSFALVYLDADRRPHPVGRLTVRSNDSLAVDQVKDALIVILVNSALKTLVLWAIFRIVIHRMVGRPLDEISTFVRRLDPENLGARPLLLKGRGGHELHLLAQVFNAMAAKLRRAFDDNATLMHELKEANATLQARVDERTRDLVRLARTDQLTGLSNRRELDENLEAEMVQSAAGSRFCLVLADIDHFKSINDRHGHAAGDAVLVACAQALRGGLRPGDRLGRWGGEEFLILCPATGLGTARVLAEEMRRRVEGAAMPAAGGRTCSFGVAEHRDGESVDDLLVRADAALYAAKRNGRNRVEAVAGDLPPDRRSAA